MRVIPAAFSPEAASARGRRRKDRGGRMKRQAFNNFHPSSHKFFEWPISELYPGSRPSLLRPSVKVFGRGKVFYGKAQRLEECYLIG